MIGGLGLDRHPELLPIYFGNYRRVVYLSQTEDPATLTAAARRPPTGSASRSSTVATGFGELGSAIAGAGPTASAAVAPGTGTRLEPPAAEPLARTA